MSETDSTGEELLFQDAQAPTSSNNDSSPSNSSGSSEEAFVEEEEETSEASSEAYVENTDEELFASTHQEDDSAILVEPEDGLVANRLNFEAPAGTSSSSSVVATGTSTQPQEVRSLLSGDMLSSSGVAPQEGDEEAVVESSESEEYSEEITASTVLTPRVSNRRQDRTVRLNVETAAGGDGGDSASTASDSENWELRHLLNVLGLSYGSRRRMRGEGIVSVGDLYDIETLLREGEVRNLKSVETAKLLQFLDWVKVYQTRANGCLPDIERHFTSHEYEGYMETRRNRNYSHVWPFMAIDESDYETRILSLPVTYSLNVVTAVSTDPDGERIGIAPAATTNAGDTSRLSAIHVSGIDDSGEAGVSAFRATSSARIRDNFIVAEEAHARFQFESRSRRRLKRAMDRYRLVVDDTAVTLEDCMIQAFCCIKLAILLRRVEFKNVKESHDLFQRAAEQFKVPTAMFFYGYDLVIGRGSAAQDVSKGISLLESAASAGIGEAYFVLGNIHEGEIKGARMDLHAAQKYYEVTSNVFKSSPHRAWLGMFTERRVNEFMPVAGMVSHWDAEFTSSQDLVQAKGWYESIAVFPSAMAGVCNWIVLAQTFLLGAAAVLTRQSQTEHYSGLLPAIPSLGTLLSLLSTANALDMIWRNRKQRAQIREMQQAKSTAFRIMLKVPLWNTIFVPPLHYIPLFYSYITRWLYEGSPQYCRPQLEALEAKILWLEARGYSALTLLWSGLVDVLVLLVALAFLSTWIVLLIQETQSYQDECSNWWDSTCQGSLVRCNEEEQKLGTCFFFGPGGATFRSAGPLTRTDLPSSGMERSGQLGL